jgi:hypothetical protein
VIWSNLSSGRKARRMLTSNELMLNALLVTRLPESLQTIKTDMTYPSVDQLLAKFRDVQYYLHAGKLYFVGDRSKIETSLTQAGFSSEYEGEMKVNPIYSMEIVRPILYKALRFFLLCKGFVWKPKIKNEVFITNPAIYQGTQLIHRLENFSKEEMFIHEGFRFYLEAMIGKLFLSLVPRVTPLLPIKGPKIPRELVVVCERRECDKREECKLPKKKVEITTAETFYSDSGFCPYANYYVRLFAKKIITVPFWTLHFEAFSATIRERGFYIDFKKIAQKRNFEKRNILNVFSDILSDNKKEVIIPVGNIKEGMILNSEYFSVEVEKEKFYD